MEPAHIHPCSNHDRIDEGSLSATALRQKAMFGDAARPCDRTPPAESGLYARLDSLATSLRTTLLCHSGQRSKRLCHLADECWSYGAVL